MSVENQNSRAKEFYEITKDKPPSPLLVRAVELLAHSGKALDLGCGAGRDTKFLLEQGFEVTAVDKNPLAAEMLAELPEGHLRFVNKSFQEFEPERYDLVNAQWSIPFTNREIFNEVFIKIKDSIETEGFFTGQLFGINDEWNTPEREMTFHTEEEVRELFKDMDLIEFKEEDIDSSIANGTPKHWHIFHIIARKIDNESEN